MPTHCLIMQPAPLAEWEGLRGSQLSLHSAASAEELDRERLDRDEDQKMKDAELHDAFTVNVISMDEVYTCVHWNN